MFENKCRAHFLTRVPPHNWSYTVVALVAQQPIDIKYIKIAKRSLALTTGQKDKGTMELIHEYAQHLDVKMCVICGEVKLLLFASSYFEQS